MIRPDAGAWSGFVDRFGERAAAVDADGHPVEHLRLSTAFTPAYRALADRVAQLDVPLATVARALRLERDGQSGRLILTSERVAGLRLPELLMSAVGKSVIADLGAALFVMRRLLTIAESLQAATGESRFGIDSDRIVITPRARVVIVEPVLAAVEEDPRPSADIAGIAVAGMSILLGRPIEDGDNIDPLSPVLQDAADVAAIRAGDPFSTALRLWLDRAIVTDPALSFSDFRQARLALLRVKPPREAGCVASRQTLKAFLDELASDELSDPRATALEASRTRTIRGRRRARWKAIAAPDEEWLLVEDDLAAADEPARIQVERHDDVVGELAYEIARDALSLDVDTAAPPEDFVPASARVSQAPTGGPEPTGADPAASIVWAGPTPEHAEAAGADDWLDGAVEEEPEESIGIADGEPPIGTLEASLVEVEQPTAAALFELSTTPLLEPTDLTQEAASPAQDVSAAIPEPDAPTSSPWTEEPRVEQAEATQNVEWTEPVIEDEPVEVQPVELAAVEEEPIEAPTAEWAAAEDEPIEVQPVELAAVEEEPFEAPTAEWTAAEDEPIEVVAPAPGDVGGVLPDADESLVEPWTEPGQAAEASPPESPSATVDGPSAAQLAEDAHTSWIRSVTEQLGRMRRQERVPNAPVEATAIATDTTLPINRTAAESPGEPLETEEETRTLFDEEAVGVLAAGAPMDIEAAATPVQRAAPPAAWETPEPAPWRDDTKVAGRAVPLPARPAAHDHGSFDGLVHEQAADAQPARLDAQPAKDAARRREFVPPPREWKRTMTTTLGAGLALIVVAGVAIAGRSYYKSVNAPGTIAVDSTPRGSEVLVNGATRGVTPLTVTLKPGDRLLELRRNGIARQFPIAVTPGAQLSQQLNWSTVRAAGTLKVSSTPPGATVIVDGQERGATPVTLADVPAGTRRVVIESSAGTVRRDVIVVADSQVTIDETIISGWIAAFAPFELQIYEGTRLLGTTQDGRIMVPPGRHDLDFVNTRLGYRERRGVDVNPGTTTAVNITTVVGIVRIAAAVGADVLIDGTFFGETPLAELRVPIGTHEIVLRHPQLGEQRVFVTVNASTPTEVSVDFSKR